MGGERPPKERLGSGNAPIRSQHEVHPAPLLVQGSVQMVPQSFLRAKGVTPGDLNARIGHSLLDALQEALARDLPPPPVEVLRNIQFIAPHHRNDQFLYFAAAEGEFPNSCRCSLLGLGFLARSPRT